MEKKFLIPTILGVVLLAAIIFTVVYKKTDGTSPNKPNEIATVAPTETEPIESKVSTQVKDSTLSDFKVNETQVHGKDISELVENNAFVMNIDLEETRSNGEGTNNSDSESTSKNNEILSDEEVNKIVQQQLDAQIVKPYDSNDEIDELNEEEMASIEAETEGDLSKYEMDTSILNDPEKIQEMLHNMGY